MLLSKQGCYVRLVFTYSTTSKMATSLKTKHFFLEEQHSIILLMFVQLPSKYSSPVVNLLWAILIFPVRNWMNRKIS